MTPGQYTLPLTFRAAARIYDNELLAEAGELVATVPNMPSPPFTVWCQASGRRPFLALRSELEVVGDPQMEVPLGN